MRALTITVLSVLFIQSNSQFDPQIRVLGNLVLGIGTHLFARFTDTEQPRDYETGKFMDQINYIHVMLKKMRDYCVNPPDDLKDQLRSLTQTFSFQVQGQLPNLDIADKDLKDKFKLTDSEIMDFKSKASDCKVYVEEIIKTRGPEIPDKYE